MRALILIQAMVGLIMIISSSNPISAQEPEKTAGLLDGRVFVGHVGPKDGAANGEDDVVFQSGQFLSTSCSKYGFTAAPYTASMKGAVIVFDAVTRSPKHGQIIWNGQVENGRITATYLWTKERWYWFDAHEENWFKGQLRTD